MQIDQLIRTSRKTIALIVQHDGRLVVRAPLHATDAEILRFVRQKADWIKAKQELVKKAFPQAVPRAFVDGEGFWYLGKVYRLEIVTQARVPLLLTDGRLRLAHVALPQAQAVFLVWYQAQARQILTDRVRRYAVQHGFTYHQIKITSARTRWGSCSARGTLSFPYRLVMAPMRVIDYVVVHELVHLQVKNHSTAFWQQVQALMPNYQQQRAWLRANGHLLTLE